MARTIRLLAAVTVVFLSSSALATTCNPACEPDPSVTGYLTTVQNRVKVSNARGKKGVFDLPPFSAQAIIRHLI